MRGRLRAAFVNVRRTATAWTILSVVLLGFGATYFLGILAHPPPESLEDYSAFYCADRLIAAHENPYERAGMAACERSNAPWLRGVFVAPYPPYALMLVAPLSALPFRAAGALWLFGIVACIVGSCFLLSRITTAPLAVSFAAFACTMWFPSMIAASMEAYPVFFMLLATRWIATQRWTWAALALAPAMIKPNIALPVCIAVFLAVAQMRWRLVVVGALTFAAQSLYAGVPLFIAYLRFVRPYSLTEVIDSWQYSLTYALHQLGASNGVALEAGWLQYAAVAGAGIAVGVMLSAKYRTGIWSVFVPMAFAIVGGIYSRVQELGACVPLALALAYLAGSAGARYALVLLATPWSAVYGDAFYPPFALLSTGTIVHALWRPARWVTLAVACAAVAALLSFPNGTTTSNHDWFWRHLPAWLGQAILVAATVSALVPQSKRAHAV